MVKYAKRKVQFTWLLMILIASDVVIYFFGQIPDNRQYYSMKLVRSSLYYYRSNSQTCANIFKCINLQKNYYKVLDVNNDACENSIKRAYLKMVKKCHPDYNPSGHDEFTEVQQAYNILSDKKLKGYYDQNNHFYETKHSSEANPQYEDFRNEEFHSRMKGQYRRDYSERQQEPKEPEETQQEAKERRKFEDEIKLTRKILFTKNPIWQRANAYMNYEQRQRRVEQKQKEFEQLFPKGAKFMNQLKKWMK